MAQEIKAALLGEAGTLRPLYLLMLALESGDWQEVKKLAQQFRLSDADLAGYYWEAMEWARQITAGSLP